MAAPHATCLSRRRRPRGRAACAALVLALAVSGAAIADRVPIDKCAPILVRALAYDRALRARAGDSVTLAVVYHPGTPSSVSEASTAVSAFKKLESLTVQGLPFRVVRLAYGPDLSAKLASEGVDALFLADGLSSEVNALTAITRRNKIVTLATDESDIRAGAAIGVAFASGKPTLMVNIAASKAEGADLSSELLRLARVIR